MSFKSLKDITVKNKDVIMRVDFNCPIREEKGIFTVSDDTRIRAALPTITYLLEKGVNRLVLMSHLGRPKGEVQDKYRLEPVAKQLAKIINKEKQMSPEIRYLATDGPATAEQQEFVADAPENSITLIENTRFDSREKSNDPELAKILASYGTVYVNDAFGTAHRAHASTEGVAHFVTEKAAGLLLEKEVTILGNLIKSPKKPFKVIIGGAKVSDKIGVIENLLDVVDEILIGGAMAYTFFKAQGGEVGKSLVEDDKLELARELMAKAKEKGVIIRLPEDSLCAVKIDSNVVSLVHPSDKIPDHLMGLDAGPAAIESYIDALQDAKTVLWNGPLGVFEVPPFDKGTRTIANLVADLNGFVVVGGGDSVAAINASGVADSIEHISTGGGASLELLEGKKLPGVVALS